VQEDLRAAERQAEACLDLPAWRGLDARAHDLGRIGAEVDHHHEERGRLGRELDPEAGQDRRR
jgi:hypothetical protein